MMSRAYDAFANLATVDGTVHDRNTVYMFAAAALICLLSIYFVYNLIAMTVNGAKRTFRISRRVATAVVGERSPQPVATPAPKPVRSAA